MRVPIYQIDAFAGRLFQGNPAAVCLFPGCSAADWPAPELLQAIAAENNLAETAFLLVGDDPWLPESQLPDPIPLRWFTPTVEMDLCGHATLAAAAVIFRHRPPGRNHPRIASAGGATPSGATPSGATPSGAPPAGELRFGSCSGPLRVFQSGEDLLALDFPSRPPVPCDVDPGLVAAVGGRPAATLRSRDVVLVYDTEEEIRALAPDFARMIVPDALGVIVTAPGRQVDFVSRFFAPAVGVPEDPVTGSAHCTLIPYWAERLGQSTLTARQLSPRGGELWCRLVGDRVEIGGRAVPYLEGFIDV